MISGYGFLFRPDKRTDRRMRIVSNSWTVQLVGDDNQRRAVRLVDLSTGGFAALLDAPCQEHVMVRAEIDMCGFGKIDVVAYPVHSTPVSNRHRVGFAFGPMNDADRHALRDAIDFAPAA